MIRQLLESQAAQTEKMSVGAALGADHQVMANVLRDVGERLQEQLFLTQVHGIAVFADFADNPSETDEDIGTIIHGYIPRETENLPAYFRDLKPVVDKDAVMSRLMQDQRLTDAAKTKMQEAYARYKELVAEGQAQQEVTDAKT